MLETLQTLDTLDLRFFSEAGSSTLLNIALGFIMFGIALELKTDHFKKVILDPKPIIIGVISQFVLLPFVTFLFCMAISRWITPTVAMGMILVAACPGGNISNFITNLAKGNTALSVSLTAISTIAAIFFTPFNFALYGKLMTNFYTRHSAEQLVRPLEIDPTQMFYTVFILLGIPLVLGLLTAYYLPAITKKSIKTIKITSLLLFIAIVVIAIFKNLGFFLQYAVIIFSLVAVHNAVALATGYAAGTVGRVGSFNRRSITIETGIQNSGLGLVLLFNPKIFPPDLAIGGMAFIAAGWGVWHIISGIGLATIWAKIPLKPTK